jgi:putative CocE/NonD family hydrolase
MLSTRRLLLVAVLVTVLGARPLAAQQPQPTQPQPTQPQPFVAREHYIKEEHAIPVRDGVKLHTVIYRPKDTSKKHPFLMQRTPYSAGPYGEGNFRGSLGPNQWCMREGYIFVYQDVRGCHRSEGKYRHMTPHIDAKNSPQDVDESSDTYDTIEWLLKNIPGHNGRVGQWGISYPGFYAAAGMIDAHPALKAVSPQAPVSDFYFDDFHHHGAFFLPHAFNFFTRFQWPAGLPRFNHPSPDGYKFFLELGPLKNIQERYFKGQVSFWNDLVEHPNYDEYWQSRNIIPHLHKTAPASLIVGGWYDAEDLYGPLRIFRSVNEKNPGVWNGLVMGPWRHGGWSGGDGDRLGNAWFGSKTSPFYQEHIEAPFFRQHLKDGPDAKLPKAYVFETGANQWRQFDQWPPKGVTQQTVQLLSKGRLALNRPAVGGSTVAFDEFISDPAHPVPFTEAISTGMTVEYMTDDQRFASRRPDVLTYQTDVLENDLTLAGPIFANLWVSTNQGDADWVVKVIDVFPDNASEPPGREVSDEERQEDRKLYRFRRPQAGYQMMVRSEVLRGRFRNSFEKPEPFKANEPTLVKLPLQDVLHTFKKGHRLMVQVQSTWFPLVDRNPQKWVDNIFKADEADFVKATHRVYLDAQHPTTLEVGVLGIWAMKQGE